MDTATTSASCAHLLYDHMHCILLCQQKTTLTNVLCTAGKQQADWSADYRLYSKNRVDETALFSRVLREIQGRLASDAPLVVALDDTLVRKSGRHIDGVKWRRDPLGPPFQQNLVLGQRYIQLSAAWPLKNGQSRMVPLGFHHAPTVSKLPAHATADQVNEHREQKKQKCLNSQALEHMRALRKQVDLSRRIVFCGDGSYTNQTVIKELPNNCTYIGRIRKDAKLHYQPQDQPQTGRRRSYGPEAPTPDALRRDESTAWQNVEAFASGKRHSFKVKTLRSVMWRKSGAQQSLSVLVIAPLGYRLRTGSRLLYRQPAFLICTDPNLDVAQLLQFYMWRWGIEVNFREEKTLLGAGSAQVRTAHSNQHLPAVVVASYAMLWIAALTALDQGKALPLLQPPKWRRHRPPASNLPSTGDLLRLLRYEMWAEALRPPTFCHFVDDPASIAKSQKPLSSPSGALFYAA